MVDKLLHLKPEIVEKMRRTYHLDDPERRRQAVETLRDWVKKQDHLVNKEYTDKYLEWRILTRKGSIERAKESIDRICTLRTVCPHMFGVYNVKDFGNLYENVMCFALPQVLENDVRVYIVKLLDKDPVNTYFLNLLRYELVMTEFIASRDYIEKVITIIDMRGANLTRFVTDVDNILDYKRQVSILMDGYGARPQKIFLITTSTIVERVKSITRAFLKPKIMDRIQVIPSHEGLYQFIPREILPRDYGGDAPPMRETQELWTEVLSSEECLEVVRTMDRYRTDEARRTTGQFSEQYAGMDGSFRYMNID